MSDGSLRYTLTILAVVQFNSMGCGPASEVHEGASAVTDETQSATLDSAALYLRRGRLYMKERTYTRAIAQLRQSVRLNPESAQAQSMLGLAYALRLKPGKAIEHIEKALALEPENGTYYMHLGKAYMLLTDYTAAKAAYERAIELGLRRGKPYYDLGIISERENKLDDARLFYQKVIELIPEFAPSCNLRLGIAEKQGDGARAIELYGAALAGNGDLTTAHYRIAQLYLETGRDALAQTHLQQFQRLKVAEGRQEPVTP